MQAVICLGYLSWIYVIFYISSSEEQVSNITKVYYSIKEQ